MIGVEKRAEWKSLADAATEGPWYWRNTQDVYLFGARSRVVMAFNRMGMQRAQPVFRGKDDLLYPAGKENINGFADAAFIAAAREAVPALLADAAEWEESSANWQTLYQQAKAEAQRLRDGVLALAATKPGQTGRDLRALLDGDA